MSIIIDRDRDLEKRIKRESEKGGGVKPGRPKGNRPEEEAGEDGKADPKFHSEEKKKKRIKTKTPATGRS